IERQLEVAPLAGRAAGGAMGLVRAVARLAGLVVDDHPRAVAEVLIDAVDLALDPHRLLLGDGEVGGLGELKLAAADLPPVGAAAGLVARKDDEALAQTGELDPDRGQRAGAVGGAGAIVEDLVEVSGDLLGVRAVSDGRVLAEALQDV